MSNRPANLPPTGRTLGRAAAFRVSAAVVAHTLWTSAAPALSYPLYAARWHLTPTVTTGMFAVYPIAVVLTLLLFGNLSDHVGRRLPMLAGVASSLAGVLLFALAPGVGWLYAGRALMGLGVGLSAGPSTAALVEFSRPGEAGRANVVATAATAFGVGMATLLGGALIQYAPWPLHLNFLVLAADRTPPGGRGVDSRRSAARLLRPLPLLTPKRAGAARAEASSRPAADLRPPLRCAVRQAPDEPGAGRACARSPRTPGPGRHAQENHARRPARPGDMP